MDSIRKWMKEKEDRIGMAAAAASFAV